MKDRSHNPGFSLTEVLLAVGTLAIGMLFIAGTFLAGVYFTTVSTERTIAAIAADEAFAKIKLYDPDFAGLLFDSQRPLEMIRLKSGAFFPPDEFAYPSTDTVTDKQYYWSALCRRLRLDVDPNSRLVQVTVFVSRKIAAHTRYRNPVNPLDDMRPVPVEVGVFHPAGAANNVLTVETGKEMFINDGYTIVSNQSGQIYRVVERDAAQPNRIILDKVWGVGGASVWVIPPPFDSGRYPCIAVYQKVMRF
jgi:hypothetical protein